MYYIFSDAELKQFREEQALRLFDEFGRVLGCKTFPQYLNGTDSLEAVPPVPRFSNQEIWLFGHGNLCLVDGRVPEKVGIKECLRILGIGYWGKEDSLPPHRPELAKSGLRWMLAQDGRRNHGRAPYECQRTFAPFEVEMDWVEGVSVFVQEPRVIMHHVMHLPGSVHPHFPEVAALGVYRDNELMLSWAQRDVASSDGGAASRGR